jgi:hypothetical protein
VSARESGLPKVSERFNHIFRLVIYGFERVQVLVTSGSGTIKIIKTISQTRALFWIGHPLID